jgi:hypothetical protein
LIIKRNKKVTRYSMSSQGVSKMLAGEDIPEIKEHEKKHQQAGQGCAE